MNKRFMYLIPIAVILLVSLACDITIVPSGSSISKEDLTNTAIAQTNQALTIQALSQTQTAQALTIQALSQQQPALMPTNPPPVAATTEAPPQPPTSTPKPCNKAVFITETIPDGTQYHPNKNFTKSWRFRNEGTCTWNMNYQIVFFSGDQMSGPAVKNFTQNVAPGEQVDITVDLKSPSLTGSYKGYWKLRSDTSEYFVNNMWVAIEVKSMILILKIPDLRISAFNINPATPTMGVPATITITAYNGGNGNAGPFVVRWYGLSTFANASCAWAFPGLAAGASDTETCTFTFSSWYPINKTSIVYIDHDNQVVEINEGNNSASISPFGVNSP